MERIKAKGITVQIKVSWSIEDVILYAESKGYQLTREQAGQVLDKVAHRYECSIGITWESFLPAISEVVDGC